MERQGSTLRPNVKKLVTKVGVGLLMVMAAVVGVQSPAFAVTWQGNIAPPAGGAAGGTSFYRVITGSDTIEMSVTTAGLPSGWCRTLWLDVARTPGVPSGSGTHYDIRAVRNCQPNSYRSSGVQQEGNTYGITITNIQKLTLCDGPPNVMGNCTNNDVSGIGNYTLDSSNLCARAWTRSSGGTNYFFTGGNPLYCNS